MASFSPLSFAYARVLGSALVMRIFVRHGETERLSRADSRQLLLFSILGVVINQTFFLGGLSLTTAHVAAILITTIPVFALAAAILLARGRATATKTRRIGLA